MNVSTSFKLNHGGSIPAVGLGTWQAKPGEVAQAVEHALKSGYRHIDGALCYQVSRARHKADSTRTDTRT
jgi:glycerol 2-dehydrogenase (NADP+)